MIYSWASGKQNRKPPDGFLKVRLGQEGIWLRSIDDLRIDSTEGPRGVAMRWEIRGDRKRQLLYKG